jgi:hypothetical protein
MEWLDLFVNSKQALVFLIAGEMGLFFGIFSKPDGAGKRFTRDNLSTFFLFSFFVPIAVIQIDQSPLLSLLIGAMATRLWPQVEAALIAAMPSIVGLFMRNAQLSGAGITRQANNGKQQEQEHEQKEIGKNDA